ncbi:hypothetical protein N8927_00815, partial [Crocinitomicaceae bacterium]|nr:hypothetical protein [Crocinitomicaceae bacterium]
MKTTLLFLSFFLSVSLFGQNVYIPDANFKAYLVGNPEINTNGDTEIQVSEAIAFDGIINCGYENIADLTGIEAFTALTQLFCQSNQLTSLDVSQNTALTDILCADNYITSLDVSNNYALINLSCQLNQLENLNVSQNYVLNFLDCQSNQLTSLDVSQNTFLLGLYIDNNQLTSLDISQNTSMTVLACSYNEITCLNMVNGNNINMNFVSYGNPNLNCVQVDNAVWSTANWASVDPQIFFSENCDYPSDCFATSLTELTTS